MKLAVTGSRDWWGRASVWTPLDRIRVRYDEVIIVNGKAKDGLDALVSEWTEEYANEGVAEIPLPADWNNTQNDPHFVRHLAGFVRNQKIIDERPDRLLVWANPCRRRKPSCPPGVHPSHGTADCVQRARDAKIPVSFCPRGMKW